MVDLPASAQVVIIGAGLAGLAAAQRLHAAGLEIIVLEASAAAGGRVRTDRRDGLLLDRGFQQFNPAYPAARIFDVAALDLKPFRAGVVVAVGDERYRLGDPRRWPAAALPSLRAPVGSLVEKLRLLWWAADVGSRPARRLLDAPDRTFARELARRHLDGRIERTVIRPFLAGVLGEEAMTSSASFVNLLVRSFLRGTPSLPSQGIQALPEQLVAQLAAGMLHTNTAVRQISDDQTSGGVISTDAGQIRADAIIVATDPRTAAELVGLRTPEMRALTTFYHLAGTTPSRERALHIDAERRGPLVNTAVVSNTARSYSRRGALVASTVLGADDSPDMEALVREQAGAIYGADSRRWERVASYPIRDALPATYPPLRSRTQVEVSAGLYVAGDHCDSASIQGAIASGRRAAGAVLRQFGVPDAEPPPVAEPAWAPAVINARAREVATQLRRAPRRKAGTFGQLD